MKSNRDVSRLMSLALRHQPEAIGIVLDSQGWVEVDALLKGLGRRGHRLSRAELDRVVAESDKKRFAFNEDGTRIRANQGHSVQVDLGLEPAVPPERLYHGTVEKFMDSILATGLHKGERHDVHLSPDLETATKVGSRRGKPVILEIDSGRMHREGFVFRCSANGVWLVDSVPALYIKRL